MSLRNEHCECEHVGKLRPDMASLYHPTKELPFVDHAPGECECVNDLRPYKRDGRIVMLCSCCVMNDEPVRDS